MSWIIKPYIAGNHKTAAAASRKAVMRKNKHRNQSKHKNAWALFQSGRLHDAVKLYTLICDKDRRDDSAWAMLGIIQGQLGNYLQAESYLRRAMTLNPGNFDATVNHGLALYNMGQADQAITSFRKALTIYPNHAPALMGLGNSYARLDQLTQAEKIYKHVLQHDPGNALAFGNLANVLAYEGKSDAAIDNYRSALKINPNQSGVHSNLLLCLHYSEKNQPDAIFREHLDWAQRHTGGIIPYSEYNRVKNPDTKLRIGYVTPDLRGHSVAYFIEPLLFQHDRSRFEIFCYVEVKLQDDMTRRLWKLADTVRNTAGKDDFAVAEMIHQDNIDILIDLAGHTENNRLPIFARKPAPIQMTYLGYPDTTGMDAIDYRITDHWADPPGMTEHLHTEELLRMKDGFLCFSPPSESPPVTELPAKEQGYITFGSFNVLTKITPEMLGVWAQVLHRVKDSRLLIKNRQLTDVLLHEHVAAEFEKYGIAIDRIDMLGTTSKSGHMAIYRRVDIALDTFPYNGTTTTCDTLWMGIPVISMSGETHVSRVGMSLLSRIGLDELVCVNQDEYVDCAIRLSRDLGCLSELRHNLRSRMQESTLCDSVLFTRGFETLLVNALHSQRLNGNE